MAQNIAAVEIVPLAQLRPYPRNPRLGDVDVIEQSVRAFGQTRTLVVNRRSMEVLAGNHTYHALLKLGFSEASVSFVDVDEEQAARLVLMDNRSDRAMYDNGLLDSLLEDLQATDTGIADTGWLAEDLEALLRQVALDDPGQSEAKLDEAVEPPPEPITQRGDLWEFPGGHRLLCGDSGSEADLALILDGRSPHMLLCDPPYGIALDTDYSTMQGDRTRFLAGAESGTYRPVIGDDQPFNARPLRERFSRVREQFWFGADYYRRTLSDNDQDGSWLVWDKRNEDSDAGFGSGFELIWSAARHKRDLLRHYFFGAFGADGANRMHPTQKPTPLLREILMRWSPAGGLILDPFAGVGSALVAAVQTGRTAFCIEIDPLYCDLTVARVEASLGLSAERQVAAVSA